MCRSWATRLLGGIGPALAERNYRIFIIGWTASWIGFAVQAVAMGWLTWILTESPGWLGLMGFADLVPALLFGPFAAVLADRMDRRKMLVVTQVAALAQAGVLSGLVATDLITAPLLVALAFVHGTVITFSQPAFFGVVPRLVSRKNLPSAISLNAVAGNLGTLGGPAVAGLLIIWSGPELAFAFNACAYAIYAWVLNSVSLRPTATVHRSRKTMFGDMVDGIRYACRHPGIGPMLGLTTVQAFVSRGMMHIMPGFVSDTFDRGVAGLAAIESAGMIGWVSGSAWLARRGKLSGLVGFVMLATVLNFTATGIFVFTSLFSVALALWALNGIFVSVIVAGTNTLIQSSVVDAMRGRVMGGWQFLSRGSGAIGSLTLGVLVEFYGFTWPFLCVMSLVYPYILWLARRKSKLIQALE